MEGLPDRTPFPLACSFPSLPPSSDLQLPPPLPAEGTMGFLRVIFGRGEGKWLEKMMNLGS